MCGNGRRRRPSKIKQKRREKNTSLYICTSYCIVEQQSSWHFALLLYTFKRTYVSRLYVYIICGAGLLLRESRDGPVFLGSAAPTVPTAALHYMLIASYTAENTKEKRQKKKIRKRERNSVRKPPRRPLMAQLSLLDECGIFLRVRLYVEEEVYRTTRKIKN